jgi:hypothetical protein
MNGKTLPSVYHHQVKNRPQGFQRQNAKTVGHDRRRSTTPILRRPSRSMLSGGGRMQKNTVRPSARAERGTFRKR